MLKPIMSKHFLTIILILLCLLVSRPAEARFTLGVVTGSNPAAGEITPAQADSLASLLAEKLHEEVVVKKLADQATLIDWLDRFAMLDLALLSTKEVQARPGRFLQIGVFDEQDRLSLVSRQGVDGDLPQRVAAVVRAPGFALWSAVEKVVPAGAAIGESPPLAEPGPATADPETASPVELEHVPPLSPGRAWIPQEESAYRDILPADGPPMDKLVFGVFPDPKGLVRTPQQVEQLASYLNQALPVAVTVREFTRAETFVEWFMRHRMIDLAIVSPAFAKAHLGHEYLPLAKLFRGDKRDLEPAAVVVMRQGQNEALQVPLQGALLDLKETGEGQSLLAALGIGTVLAPEGGAALKPDAELASGQMIELEQPLLARAEAIVDEPVSPTTEESAPVEPAAPPVVAVMPLPELAGVAEPAGLAPVAMPGVASLPEPAVVPAAAVVLPGVASVEVPVPQGEPPLPQSPEVAPPLTVDVAAAQPEDPTPVEPAAPSVAAVLVLPELPAVAEPAGLAPLAMPGVASLPEPAVAPAAAVVLPGVASVEVAVPQGEPPLPQSPEVAPPLIVDVAVGQPGEPAPVEPAAPSVVAVLPLPELPAVAEPSATMTVTGMPAEAQVLPEPGPASVEPAPMTVLEELKVPPVLERQAAPPQSVGLPLPVVSAPVSQPVFVEPELLATAVEPVQTLLPGEASQPPVEVEPLVVAAPLRRADGSVADLGQPVLTEMLPPDSIPVPEGLPQVTIAAPSTVEIDAAPSVASLEMVEPPPLPEEAEAWSEEVFAAVLGQDMVAAVVAQPDIPQELRPSGVPIVRPGRIAGRNTAVDESLLLASLPEPRKNVVPPGPPKLLPEPEPEPGIVYVVPFIAVMVPDQVNARVFDQFVDNLNSQGDALGLQFVILKEGLQRVSPHWLAIRRYVTGELYAYVEDSGCCSTDLRTKARLTYHHPNQEAPAFGFEYPVRKFFEHDRSSLDIERLKLADDIAENLSRELLKALQN